jgi:hypothetical protein
MTVIRDYDEPEYAKLKKKKLISVFEYEKTNIFEDGDSFGSIGTNSKVNKRTATSVAYEKCEIGSLTKDDYIRILEKMNSKARDRLYDLVISNKIFVKLSKYSFIHKYIHMFHFTKYYKNNIIMNSNQKFNKLIILYKGEFTISINKDIIELNELIVKVKKIRGKLMGIPEEIIKKDLKEINENKLLHIKLKYSSKNINDLISKRYNYIITKIKDDLILGYPNSIDSETNFPLFNCECSSNFALGYTIENDMLKLMQKERYIRRNPPEIAISHLDLFLERLLELRNIIMEKINNIENIKTDGNNINVENNYKNKNDNKDDNYESNEDEKNEIKRNESPKRIKNTASVLFDFNKKILVSDFGKSFKKKN